MWVVKDKYKDVRGIARSSVWDTEKFPVKLELHPPLSPYLLDIVLDIIAEDVGDVLPWTMMFADDVVLNGRARREVEKMLEDWKKVSVVRG